KAPKLHSNSSVHSVELEFSASREGDEVEEEASSTAEVYKQELIKKHAHKSRALHSPSGKIDLSAAVSHQNHPHTQVTQHRQPPHQTGGSPLLLAVGQPLLPLPTTSSSPRSPLKFVFHN
ncbi:hypothetical protein GBA52_023803, partial [Prunus armeniaca]